ncbi:MAG: RsmD family RNA methyltransferase, partial [Methylobacterium sp.]
MRIVAGSRKGRPLATPEGEGIRPTSERHRGALFDI